MVLGSYWSPRWRLRVIGLTRPAIAADAVRGARLGLAVCLSHSTRSRTSAGVALSHSTPTARNQRHHRSRSYA
jgi:hypothetical protein